MTLFPYGKAALSLLIIAILTGSLIAMRRTENRTATLTIWTFAKTHYEAYQTALPAFEAKHPNVKVKIEHVTGQAINARLQAAMLANLDVPDLVEVEISSAGTFFRGTQESIGFLDLTDRIKQSGLWERMVQSRFAPYSSRGRIYGLPHDVHPVMLAYRRDIFEQEGIDPKQLQTWDDFIRAGRKLTKLGQRYMIELSDNNSQNLEPILFQNGGGYFDSQGNCIFDNEISVQTMLFYVPLVAGANRIGSTLGENQVLTKALEQDYMLCLFCPDWRSKFLEREAASMSGKMALMPLPAPRLGGLKTSTWGGTMLGITRHCAKPDLAWELMQHLYLEKSDLAGRFRDTNILPALRDAWDQPVFQEPRPYWNGQKLGALYAELAPQVPFQYANPYITTAKAKLGEALVSCVQYYNRTGSQGFEDHVRRSLKRSADETRRLMARNPYQNQ